MLDTLDFSAAGVHINLNTRKLFEMLQRYLFLALIIWHMSGIRFMIDELEKYFPKTLYYKPDQSYLEKLTT